MTQGVRASSQLMVAVASSTVPVAVTCRVVDISGSFMPCVRYCLGIATVSCVRVKMGVLRRLSVLALRVCVTPPASSVAVCQAVESFHVSVLPVRVVVNCASVPDVLTQFAWQLAHTMPREG